MREGERGGEGRREKRMQQYSMYDTANTNTVYHDIFACIIFYRIQRVRFTSLKLEYM